MGATRKLFFPCINALSCLIFSSSLFPPQAVDYELKSADEINQAKTRIQLAGASPTGQFSGLLQKTQTAELGTLLRKDLVPEYEAAFHEAQEQMGRLVEVQQKMRHVCNQVRLHFSNNPVGKNPRLFDFSHAGIFFLPVHSPTRPPGKAETIRHGPRGGY